MTWLHLLYLLIGLGSGWLIAQHAWPGGRQSRNKRSPTHFLPPLNVSDAALERFIQSLEVRGGTLETHLALAALYRQRGELDRATRLHRNLLERPDLKPAQRQLAELELARDYLRGGMYDHGEQLFQHLVESAPVHRVAALHSLLELYQEEREWERAIHVAAVLVDEPGDRLPRDYNRLSCHFYCELALQALNEEDYLGARRSLSRAMHLAPDQARPHLLLARLETQLKNTAAALSAADQAAECDHVAVGELVTLYRECLPDSAQRRDLRERLDRLFRAVPEVELLIALLDVERELEGESRAIDRLHARLLSSPSLQGLAIWLRETGVDTSPEKVSALVQVLAESDHNAPHFRCARCGFQAREHVWCCPTCKSWSSLVYNGVPANR